MNCPKCGHETKAPGMSLRRFNDLLNGPLYHPLAPMFIMRLAGALQHVIWACGSAGAAALEEYAKMREECDRQKGGES